MADKSKIEWTDATWNPITGCSIHSPGCINCYAMGLAGTRLKNHPSRAGLTKDSKTGPVWTGEVRFNEGWLTQPLSWKKPRMVFVCAHGDLFHEDVPDAWIDKVFAVMALAPQHTFQVLTKRANRMREYLTSEDRPLHRIHHYAAAADDAPETWGWCRNAAMAATPYNLYLQAPWPLPNVWLGVSAERQQEADERIPELLATPAAVRFLSLEPLLGPIDLGKIAAPKLAPDDEAEGWKFDCLATGDYYTLWAEDPLSPNERCVDAGDGPYRETRIDWVIIGGESGDNARSMHPDWARAIRADCQSQDVPFFFKQWGEWAPSTEEDAGFNPHSGWMANAAYPHVAKAAELYPEAGAAFVARVGKKAAGRLLDGVEHNGMPRRTEP